MNHVDPHLNFLFVGLKSGNSIFLLPVPDSTESLQDFGEVLGKLGLTSTEKYRVFYGIFGDRFYYFAQACSVEPSRN